MADELLEALCSLTGRADAEFHPDQREAIEALVNGRDRVLLVERTGWGKSAVYFLATHLLRRRGLLISPLLALIGTRSRASPGLSTLTVNAVRHHRQELAAALATDEVDLLVSPERLANPSSPQGDAAGWSPAA
jgi:ATP-dependent DNA helicase RecQ